MRNTVENWDKPDYTKIYRERTARLNKLREQAVSHESWKLAYRHYRKNPVEAIEDWAFTFDPRQIPKGNSAYMPFILFPKQRELIEWMYERYTTRTNGVIEKSRDMGVSWLMAAFSWYLWTFHHGATTTFGSRKEKYVDELGDPDSLLEKVRLIIRRLPAELIPTGLNEKKHFNFLKITNPSTGGMIKGEAGDEIGRGGRSTIAILDEFAFIPRAEGVDAAISQNSDIVIYLSTSAGDGNLFYDKVHSGEYPVFRFHWSDDPRKNQEWYDEQLRRYGPEIVAREIDICYEKADGAIAISPIHVRSSKALRSYFEEKKGLEAISKLPRIGGFDVAAGGSSKNVYIIRQGPYVFKPASLQTDDLIDAAGWAKEIAETNDVTKTKFDAIGVGKGILASFRRWKTPSDPVTVGDRPTRTVWPDKKRAHEKFSNLKAELWWTVRDALRKTHEHWLFLNDEGGQEHSLEELLLLPDDPELCRELCLPRAKYLETGKIQIERKTELANRGVKSPDHAEALVLTFAPSKPRFRVRSTTGLW